MDRGLHFEAVGLSNLQQTTVRCPVMEKTRANKRLYPNQFRGLEEMACASGNWPKRPVILDGAAPWRLLVLAVGSSTCREPACLISFCSSHRCSYRCLSRIRDWSSLKLHIERV